MGDYHNLWTGNPHNQPFLRDFPIHSWYCSSIVFSFGNESVEIMTHDTTLATFLGFYVIRYTHIRQCLFLSCSVRCRFFSAEKLAWAIEIRDNAWTWPSSLAPAQIRIKNGEVSKLLILQLALGRLPEGWYLWDVGHVSICWSHSSQPGRGGWQNLNGENG